jgi:exodeoxyribonuclease-3
LFSPTDLDIYAPGRWVDDALFRPEVRDAYRRPVEQGWTSAECWAHSVD